jgi:adenylosuccinate synthase
MCRKASIVIGMGYGDEGKGLTTDFLCSSATGSLVIRFNGGHQAGHTVVMKDGMKHIFSNFGAGTLRNIPTFWSRYCTFSPAYLLYELDTLPVLPRLYLDWHCPVTTHYDVLYNRKLEERRNLGSCGVGFGATIDRHFVEKVQFFAGELLSPKIYKEKLKEIRKYYKRKFNEETALQFSSFKHDEEDEKFYQDVDELQSLIGKRIISFTNEQEIFSSKEWTNYVFEGAQGILLDQQFGFKPYITKSNTTTKNALTLLKKNTILTAQDISVLYVTVLILLGMAAAHLKNSTTGLNYGIQRMRAMCLTIFKVNFEEGS